MDTLRLLHPGARLTQADKDLKRLTQSLQEYSKQLLKQKQAEYVLLVNKLELINPLSIMKKGYSIASVDGRIVTSVEDVTTGASLEVTLKDGTVQTIVKDIRKDDQNER
jgi:exodeoxyribonuclease VII large subunit